MKKDEKKSAGLSENERDIVMDAIKFLDGNKYDLYCAVVMPDHFHIIIQPVEKKENAYYSVTEIMHSIKSFTAHKIKNSRSTVSVDQNQIWQQENYDRIIRDEREVKQKIEYLMKNPLMTGLVQSVNDYKWLYIKGSNKQDGVVDRPGRPIMVLIWYIVLESYKML